MNNNIKYVKCINNDYYDTNYLTIGKVYDVITQTDYHNGYIHILIKNDLNYESYCKFFIDSDINMFKDVTKEYTRNSKINEILE